MKATHWSFNCYWGLGLQNHRYVKAKKKEKSFRIENSAQSEGDGKRIIPSRVTILHVLLSVALVVGGCVGEGVVILLEGGGGAGAAAPPPPPPLLELGSINVT